MTRRFYKLGWNTMEGNSAACYNRLVNEGSFWVGGEVYPVLPNALGKQCNEDL
jgi:hypothetical protein